MRVPAEWLRGAVALGVIAVAACSSSSVGEGGSDAALTTTRA
jgi:hypothetical protein